MILHPRSFVRLLLPVAVAGVFLLPGPGAQAQAPGAVVPGEVVVQIASGVTRSQAGRLAEEFGAEVERVSSRGGFVTLSVAPGDEDELLARLAGDPAVQWAELNAVRQPAVVPGDALYGRQWDMEMIEAPKAWNVTRGAGVTIAVLDTGVAYENYDEFGRSPELSEAFFVTPRDTTTDSDHANDRAGHGTHVTGTLAQDWDAVGVAGLAPKASIMPVRVCTLTGCSSDAMADGVYWAVSHGADVLNISLSGPTPTAVEREALEYAEEHGVVVVAAAGNGGGDLVGNDRLEYPARYETVVSVGSVNALGDRAGYSSYGRHEGEDGLHVMAPGGNSHEDLDGDGFDDGILQSTYAHTCGGAEHDFKVFGLCSYYGTSMATPHVSGIAALVLSRQPDATPAEVRQVLGCATIDLGEEGYDDEHGAGLVQADKAVHDADDNGIVDCLDPPPTLTVTASDEKVRPGETVRLSIEGQLAAPGTSGYQATITFEPAVAKAVSCTPREGAHCEVLEDRVYLSDEPDTPLWGNFRLAYIEFEAVGALDGQTSVHIEIEAISARVPDIGLQIVRDDGSIRIADPVATVVGDLDCDNLVKAGDVIAAMRQEEGVTPFCQGLGDVNCSGDVDARDGLAIVAFLGGLAQPQSVDCPPIGISVEEPPPEG